MLCPATPSWRREASRAADPVLWVRTLLRHQAQKVQPQAQPGNEPQQDLVHAASQSRRLCGGGRRSKGQPCGILWRFPSGIILPRVLAVTRLRGHLLTRLRLLSLSALGLNGIPGLRLALGLHRLSRLRLSLDLFAALRLALTLLPRPRLGLGLSLEAGLVGVTILADTVLCPLPRPGLLGVLCPVLGRFRKIRAAIPCLFAGGIAVRRPHAVAAMVLVAVAIVAGYALRATATLFLARGC